MRKHSARGAASADPPPFHDVSSEGAGQGDATAVMIAEMNHRWYNALQILSSSLGPCLRHGDTSSFVAEKLSRVQDQVAAMADVHRLLGRGPQPEETLESYCGELCSTIIRGFDRTEISAEVRMCDAPLTAQGAMTLGAIVVELMTNALKHGRVFGHGGTVWFDLRSSESSELELLVSDSFDAAEPQGGKVPRMIMALVRSLSGELRIRVEPTYVTRISFPVC